MEQKPKKLLDQVSDMLRVKHYSIRTEQAYINWIKRFVLFNKTAQGEFRHPAELGTSEIQAFLTHLAVDENVAASTQNPCTELAEVRPSARCSFYIARCWISNWLRSM